MDEKKVVYLVCEMAEMMVVDSADEMVDLSADGMDVTRVVDSAVC